MTNHGATGPAGGMVPPGRHTIGLLLSHEPNRRLLSDDLQALQHDVSIGPWDDPARAATSLSLILVDTAAAVLFRDTLQTMRTSLATAYLPMLVLLPRDVDSLQWLQAGFDDILRMPTSRAELGARLATFLRLHERSEHQYRFHAALLESLGQAVIAVDTRLVVTYWNATAARMYGWTAAEAIGRKLDDLIIPASMAATAQTIVPRLLQGEPWTGEFLVKRKDGAEFPVLVSDSPMFNDRGELTGVIGVSADITEQKQHEAELRLWALAMSAVSDGIVITDPSQPDNPVIHVNAAFTHVTGYTPEEVLGRSLRLLQGPDTDPATVEQIQLAIDEQRDIHTTIRNYRKDGTPFWNELSIAPVRDPSGKLTHWVGIASDVTARVEADLSREHLNRAEKLRALGQMASGVAHDLNQYLGLVVGHGDLGLAKLKQPDVPLEELREHLAAMVQAALDGAATVRRLQSFARPHTDRPASVLDLGDLLLEVGQLTAPHWRDAAQQRGQPIRLSVAVEDNLIIRGWPESLREALTNLIFNAVDAMPGGGEIRLRGYRAGEVVVAEITDTGIGMRPEVQARIFEPFFTTKGERGSGLGLPMVFGIAERHGGGISVDSTMGQGTVFRLRFPASSDAAARQPSTKSPGERRPLRILAVEDEAALGQLMRQLLARDGHAAAVAATGEEALGILAAEDPFDLVISDLGLGEGMNGWQLAERVHEQYPGLPFVLATGWGAEIDSEEAKAKGILAVLPKPYRLDEIRSLLEGIAG